MTEVTSDYVTAQNVLRKRISWAAVFSGTFVALATELLFSTFGLFIGFTLSSPGGIDTWAKIWYFITAFVSLFIGGWVASRLSANTSGSGRLHGAVTWGLTTMATLAFTIWIFGGVLSTSIAALRTTVAATNTTAASPATASAQHVAGQLQNQAADTVNQVTQHTPQIASVIAGDASTFFLVIFGGILCGCVASLIGGSLGASGLIGRGLPAGTNRQVHEPAPSAKAASA